MNEKKSARIFPLSVFIAAFITLSLLTGAQMFILDRYIGDVPDIYVALLSGYWIIVAALLTFFIGYLFNTRFEKPLKRFAEATQKVANGDFSVYVKPIHLSEKKNYLDYIFIDFNTMVGQLGSIETLKTDFFSNVSHEIKTPISVIKNYAELLQKENLSEARRLEYAETIMDASESLSEMITNLLKLNKLEKEAIVPEAAPYDVSRQVCNCALNFETQWEKKDIYFVADLEDSATAELDESLMELVWNNLLSNALKFTAPGGTITLTQTSTEEEIIVSVADDGCGMNEETQKRIFDKFYQGDTSHATEGNGLGLALTMRILQLMECTISVDSIPGEGSTFTVKIPAFKKEHNVSEIDGNSAPSSVLDSD